MSLELYRRYLATVEATTFDGQLVAYGWGNLPGPLNVMWMPYREMFDEFSREIANSLNDLTNYTHRLKAWNLVVSSMTDREKMTAAHEFIDPVATIALVLPYVIRSRFMFATAHLCHHANRSRESLKYTTSVRHVIVVNSIQSYIRYGGMIVGCALQIAQPIIHKTSHLSRLLSECERVLRRHCATYRL
jgi:hypothetical protein